MGLQTQTFATSVANVCEGGCKRLREGLQTFASKTGKMGTEIHYPILSKFEPQSASEF